MTDERHLRRALIKTTPKGNLKTKYRWSPKAIIAEFNLMEKKESSQPRVIRDYIRNRILMGLQFMKQEESEC